MKYYYFTAIALGGLASAGALAYANCTFESTTPSTELKWCSCGTNYFCAKLEVPLDYKNPSKGRAVVPLLKYAATTNSSDGPYQGQVVLIPGGPGGSGIELLQSAATTAQQVVGSNWDLVSFDPRGIARSEPALHCGVKASATSTNYTRRDSVPRIADSYYDSFLKYGKELGDRCAQLSGGELDAGPHMTTAIVARDLLSITDAYARSPEGRSAAKNASLLNFYAFSYGTIVGQTFASMFPSRVGNSVLDGVLRPETYVSGWIYNSINDLDGVMALLFIYCSAAGPSVCPYATGGSAQDVFARFKHSITQLDAHRAQQQHWSNATEVEEALLTLKSSAFNAAYSPLSLFPTLAQVLLDLEEALAAGTLEQWTQQVIAAEGDPGPAGTSDFEWTLGVACSDQNDLYYGQPLADYGPALQYLEKQSILGEIWLRNSVSCSGWKIKSDDIFTGPFGGSTATPIIFLSNTYDPVTPIENSRYGAPKYKDAQIITVEGMGHTSSATMNLCAYQKIRSYFQTNELPGNNTFCAIEGTPFGAKLNGTLQQNIKDADSSVEATEQWAVSILAAQSPSNRSSGPNYVVTSMQEATLFTDSSSVWQGSKTM